MKRKQRSTYQKKKLAEKKCQWSTGQPLRSLPFHRGQRVMYKEAVLANWHSSVFHILNEAITSEYGFAHPFLSFFFYLNPKQQARPIQEKKEQERIEKKSTLEIRGTPTNNRTVKA